MPDLTFIVSETSPSISGLLAVSGTPHDLTGATVRFQMRRANDRRHSVDEVAVVVSATDGTVRYDWAVGDLLAAGDYIARWQITYADETVTYTEPENTITVEPV